MRVQKISNSLYFRQNYLCQPFKGTENNGNLDGIDFSNLSDSDKTKIADYYDSKSSSKRGLSGEVFDAPDGKHIIKKFFSKESNNYVPNSIKKEKELLDKIEGAHACEGSTISIATQRANFIDERTGIQYACYVKVNGRHVTKEDLMDPKIMKKILEAINDLDEIGLHHGDLNLGNFLIEDEE